MNSSLGIWCCLFAVGVSACASASAGGIDRHVEDRVTLSTGVYGQTTSQDDIGDSPVKYKQMMLSVSAGAGDPPLATQTSDGVGFYEFPLTPGDYSLCTSFGRCTALHVETGQCVRLDYEFSEGPGWSAPVVGVCPH